jgi:hypothetical protein
MILVFFGIKPAVSLYSLYCNRTAPPITIATAATRARDHTSTTTTNNNNNSHNNKLSVGKNDGVVIGCNDVDDDKDDKRSTSN